MSKMSHVFERKQIGPTRPFIPSSVVRIAFCHTDLVTIIRLLGGGVLRDLVARSLSCHGPSSSSS